MDRFNPEDQNDNSQNETPLYRPHNSSIDLEPLDLFIGYSSQLQEGLNIIKDSENQNSVLLISGRTGVGKTEFVKKLVDLVEENSKKFRDGIIWIDSHEELRQIQNEIIQRKHGESLLIIIDNVQNVLNSTARIRSYTKKLLPNSFIICIETEFNHFFKRSDYKISEIELDGFDTDQSVDLLNKYIPEKIARDREYAEVFVNILDNNPAAINLLGEYLKYFDLIQIAECYDLINHSDKRANTNSFLNFIYIDLPDIQKKVISTIARANNEIQSLDTLLFIVNSNSQGRNKETLQTIIVAINRMRSIGLLSIHGGKIKINGLMHNYINSITSRQNEKKNKPVNDSYRRDRSLSILSSRDNFHKAMEYFQHASHSFKFHNYDQALSDIKNCVNFTDRFGDYKFKIKALTLYSKILSEMKLYKDSLSVGLECLKIFKVHQDYYGGYLLIKDLSPSIVNIYTDTKSIKEYVTRLENLFLNDRDDNRLFRSQVYREMCRHILSQDNFELSEDLIKEAISLSNTLENKSELILNLLSLAEIYIGKKAYFSLAGSSISDHDTVEYIGSNLNSISDNSISSMSDILAAFIIYSRELEYETRDEIIYRVLDILGSSNENFNKLIIRDRYFNNQYLSQSELSQIINKYLKHYE